MIIIILIILLLMFLYCSLVLAKEQDDYFNDNIKKRGDK